jgi:hypothetical protein
MAPLTPNSILGRSTVRLSGEVAPRFRRELRNCYLAVERYKAALSLNLDFSNFEGEGIVNNQKETLKWIRLFAAVGCMERRLS